jgi:hypothetical protein
MKPAERRRLLLLFGLLGAVSLMAFWPRGGDAPRSARESASPASRRGSRGTATTTTISPEAVPTLAIADVKPTLAAPVERDPFHFAPPTPTKRPTPAPPTPTPLPAQGTERFIGPRLPTPTPTPTPIIPPAIPYKLVGMFGPDERKIAAFEDNGRLINAREGDVLDGRFIVRKVNRESVDFAFVGLPPEITRRLAVTADAGR